MSARNKIFNYSCVICEQPFSSSTQLEIHVDGYHLDDEKQWNDKSCHKLFGSVDFDEKQVDLSELRPQTLNNSRSIDSNKSDDEIVKEPFKCYIQLSKLSYSDLKKHGCFETLKSPENTKRKNISCRICQNEFSNNKSLKKHQKKVDCQQFVKNGKFFCKLCFSKFTCLKAVCSHQKFHVKESDRKFKCPRCDKKFKNNKNLLEHEIFCYKARNGYYCRLCKKHLNDDKLEHPIIHCKKVHNNSFFCELCETSFPSLWNAKRHVIKCLLK